MKFVNWTFAALLLTVLAVSPAALADTPATTPDAEIGAPAATEDGVAADTETLDLATLALTVPEAQAMCEPFDPNDPCAQQCDQARSSCVLACWSKCGSNWACAQSCQNSCYFAHSNCLAGCGFC